MTLMIIIWLLIFFILLDITRFFSCFLVSTFFWLNAFFGEVGEYYMIQSSQHWYITCTPYEQLCAFIVFYVMWHFYPLIHKRHAICPTTSNWKSERNVGCNRQTNKQEKQRPTTTTVQTKTISYEFQQFSSLLYVNYYYCYEHYKLVRISRSFILDKILFGNVFKSCYFR